MDPQGDLVRLGELVPPPDSPVRAWGDWKRFVSVNGFVPPDDYRMLIREYGVGAFAGWAMLIEPFNPSFTFMDMVHDECRALPAAASGLACWPQPGGFLPWAVTTAGDFIGWRTEGRPISWTTLLLDRQGQLSEYAVGAVGFLLGLAERRLGDARFDDGANPFARVRGALFTPAAY